MIVNVAEISKALKDVVCWLFWWKNEWNV